VSDDVLVAEGAASLVVVTVADEYEADDVVVAGGVSRLVVVAGDLFESDHAAVALVDGESVVVVVDCFDVSDSDDMAEVDCVGGVLVIVSSDVYASVRIFDIVVMNGD